MKLKLLFRIVLAICIVLALFVCIAPPDVYILKSSAGFANQYMIGFFLLGMGLLIANEEKLMLLSFGACAALAFFLKSSFFETIYYPAVKPNTPSIKLNYYSTENIPDFEVLSSSVDTTHPDIISIQEVTPDWAYVVQEAFAEKYPYYKVYPRLDFYGTAIFSKYPFVGVDTFHYEEIPNLVCTVRIDTMQTYITLMSTYTNPPVSNDAVKRIGKHLQYNAEYIRNNPYPIIAFGNYHLPPWMQEILRFRDSSRLLNSRRGFAHWSTIPVLQFFHHRSLSCIDLRDIELPDKTVIGSTATYKLTSHVDNFDPETVH